MITYGLEEIQFLQKVAGTNRKQLQLKLRQEKKPIISSESLNDFCDFLIFDVDFLLNRPIVRGKKEPRLL